MGKENAEPENMDKDAKRVQELMIEAGEIMHRRNWPGAALAICSVNDEKRGNFGFCSFAFGAVKDDASLISLYMNSDALNVRKACELFSDKD